MTVKKHKHKIFEDLERIAEIIPYPLYWTDTNFVTLGANDTIIRAVGGSRETIIGKSPYEYYPPDVAQAIIENGRAIIETKQVLKHNECIEDLSTGQVKYFTGVRGPIFDEHGEVIGIIGTSIDVTAEKEAEKLRGEVEDYKYKNEQQQQFRDKADRVVHDIRSPLTSLLILAKCCTELSEANRDTLRHATSRIQDIANDLLREYSPAKADSQEFVQVTLVSTVLLEILSEKRSQYSKSPVKFVDHFDFDSGFAFININRSDFSRSISNIINNSVEAFENKEDCLITVTIDSTEDSVILMIEDNGKGMPPEIVNKLLNNIAVTAGKDDGHGIGFQQIYDTLKSSNGKLNIDSKVGSGTCITLTFPRVPAPEWIAEEIKLNRNDIIVIVDDDPSIHTAWDAKLKVILKQAPDIQIHHFNSIRQATNFTENLSEKGKQKVLLLIDQEFAKEDITGLEFIKQSGIQRSLLVTSYYGKDKIRNDAVEANTKILPKTLAPTILIAFNESEYNFSNKHVDLVIVDDDKSFVRDFIGFHNGKSIDRYYDPEEFLLQVSNYPMNTRIYLDYLFPNKDMDGIDIAKNLHEQGYRNIYVITGNKPRDKKIPSYVKLISKEDLEELTSNIKGA